MDKNLEKSISQLKAIVVNRKMDFVKVGFFDLDGVMAGKYMSRDKFLSSLENNYGFCDVVFGWDVNDQLFDNIKLSGWHTGYADSEIRMIPDSWRELPMENNMILVLGEVVGRMQGVCPRQLLKSVLKRGQDLGFKTKTGFEYEFLVVDEPHHALRERNFNQPIPLGHGGFGYSILRTGINNDFYEALLSMCTSMKIPVEGFHEETGPGQLELVLNACDTHLAADNAALFKTFAKILAQKQGRMVSFMAKWHENYSGQGGHIHVSINRDDDSNAFYDESKENCVSDEMRYFVGGLQRLARDMMAMHAPTINSYRRLVPGYWAPTSALWGIDNRTTAIRVITSDEKAHRIEYRVPGADCNPYLTAAAIFAAGFYGIENRVEPEVAFSGNAYTHEAPAQLILPRSLWESAQCLKRSAAAREWLGEEFVDHYVATREWEEREFQKYVTDWEKSRYFEII